MSLYILDSDTLTRYRAGDVKIKAKYQAEGRDRVATSVISVEEAMGGWYIRLRKAVTPEELEDVYGRIAETASFFGTIRIVSFLVPAILRFEQLRKMKLNVGSMDLKIASIGMHFGATVVTCNLRDFKRVPGLDVEDWSV